MVYSNSGHPHFITAYHGCYDPLAYPLFYSGGEIGWEDKSNLLEQNPVIRFPRKKRDVYETCKAVGNPSYMSL